MKNKKSILLILSLIFSILVSGCAQKAAPQPQKEKNINFSLDDCERYGNLKKAVAKLILESEKMRTDQLKRESNNLKNINERIQKQEAEIKKLKQQSLNAVLAKAESGEKIESSCVGKKPQSYYINLEKNDMYFPSRKVKIRMCPYPKSKIIGMIDKNQMVEFKSCNRFGWCELKNQDGYVAGNLFTSKKTKKKAFYNKGN